MLRQSVHRECVLHGDRAGTVLYGIIVILGGRIWVEYRVNFMNPVNLLMAAIGLTLGAGNYTDALRIEMGLERETEPTAATKLQSG